MCPHRRLERLGIQKSPLAKGNLYLLTCLDCGTTLTTTTLREKAEQK